jgi:hypothetical protein|tara:strand:+ start:422 stop:619 length:198 start_codon:yes stop_codon:yes gene_type:complete
MKVKTDPMFLVFANHNTKNDPHVFNNDSFKGNSKQSYWELKRKETITTTYEVIDAVETPVIKEIQ